MSLTGLPVIFLVAFCTLAAVAATMLLWNRFGRVRYVLRAAGVLLAEGLLLLTFGLAVNRSEQFYPTWDALLDTGTSGEAVVRTADDSTGRSGTGDLDQGLAARAGGHPGAALTFAWESADWRGWGLAAAPTVRTPAGYLQHPTWSYSAVLVIGEGTAGWSAADEEAAARRATATGISAVVVFATTTASTTARALATALPGQLARDLRVSSHRWAIVTSPADAALAQSTVVAATARYPSIAVLPTGAAGASSGRSGPVRPTTTGLVLPDGVTAAAVVGDAAAPHQAGVLPLPSTAADALYTALSWAIGRTPPPLATGAPPVHGTPGKPASPPPGGHDGKPSSSLSPRR